MAGWRGFSEVQATPNQGPGSRYSASMWGFLPYLMLTDPVWYYQPLVLAFPLFSGWVSSSGRTKRNCHMSTSCGWGCYRETLWYEARGYSAWSCLLPNPQCKGSWCAHIWPLGSIMAGLPSCLFPMYLFAASQRAGKALLYECVAYQHLGRGQHHSHPMTRGCSSDLS